MIRRLGPVFDQEVPAADRAAGLPDPAAERVAIAAGESDPW